MRAISERKCVIFSILNQEKIQTKYHHGEPFMLLMDVPGIKIYRFKFIGKRSWVADGNAV